MKSLVNFGLYASTYAYYTQYLHKVGLIDKYGNKKGNIDHESLAADFYKWMKDLYEDKGNFNLDPNWVWKQSIYHGRDYE